jgi:hypothetical protein
VGYSPILLHKADHNPTASHFVSWARLAHGRASHQRSDLRQLTFKTDFFYFKAKNPQVLTGKFFRVWEPNFWFLFSFSSPPEKAFSQISYE